ncbi:DUF7344 domain-containing protein [Halocatena halophila]|uniref:DUF7344 domain-containing protein n=1 Tax=Halocatena halophila TaxID=2814576 RepID=UPI002ED66118
MNPPVDLKDHASALRGLETDTQIFDILGNLRRRTIVRYMGLLETTVAVSMTELARVCAAVERKLPVNQIDHSAYRHAYQSIRSRDIPRLESAAVLERESRDTIYRGETFGRFEQILSEIEPVFRGEQPT